MAIKFIVFLNENTLNQCLGKAFRFIKWNALFIHLMYMIIHLIALTISKKGPGFLSQYRKAQKKNVRVGKERGRAEKQPAGTKN